LYADDLVVIAGTKDYLIKMLNEWMDNVENRGMRVATLHYIHLMALFQVNLGKPLPEGHNHSGFY